MNKYVFRLLDSQKPIIEQIDNKLFRINIPKGSDCQKLFASILSQLRTKNPDLELLSRFWTIDKYTYEVQLSQVYNLSVYIPNKLIS